MPSDGTVGQSFSRAECPKCAVHGSVHSQSGSKHLWILDTAEGVARMWAEVGVCGGRSRLQQCIEVIRTCLPNIYMPRFFEAIGVDDYSLAVLVCTVYIVSFPDSLVFHPVCLFLLIGRNARPETQLAIILPREAHDVHLPSLIFHRAAGLLPPHPTTYHEECPGAGR